MWTLSNHNFETANTRDTIMMLNLWGFQGRVEVIIGHGVISLPSNLHGRRSSGERLTTCAICSPYRTLDPL